MTRWDKLDDDRGDRCEICSIKDAIQQSGYAKEFLVRSDETGRFWLTAISTGLVFAIWMQVFFLIAGISTVGFSISFLGIGIFFGQAIFFGGCMGIVVKLYGWRSSKHARQALLRAGLCPSCGYTIEDLQPEHDQCVVCPECGAAWCENLPRTSSPA